MTAIKNVANKLLPRKLRIGGRKALPPPSEEKTIEERVKDSQERAEDRAEAEEMRSMKGVQKRRRLRRTGGMRLLFSPQRLADQAAGTKPKTKLGTE